MSTRSSISYYNPTTKKYYTVYCHFDGYLSGVGLMLYKHYQDYDKVKRLISLGAMSCLEPNIDPAPGTQHSFDHPQKDVCVFYTRDRGEDWETNQPRVYMDITDISDHWDLDFNYLYMNGKWSVQRGFNSTYDWEPLEDKLRENDLIQDVDNSTITSENVKKSVDIATACDYVSSVTGVDSKIIKFNTVLRSLYDVTNDLGLVDSNNDCTVINMYLPYDRDFAYPWDTKLIEFLNLLLDLCGLKAESFEMVVKDNESRYISIIGIESK